MRNLTNKKEGVVIVVDPAMRDHSKDAFFVKKAERAKAFIAKNGLPKEKPKKGK
ncbi:MAG TPA: hypothetical protein VGM89_17340 [Puia sp.]